MFNKDFFPTPKTVIYEMIKGIEYITAKRILEPSAGKADILDYIIDLKGSYGGDLKKNMYCIELEPQLQAILKDKKYRVIADDFLEYNSDYIFDVILMNPPFSEGEKHFLKAWEISKGAEIRCLLPAEMLKNPYTAERRLIKEIVEQNGEIVNLGQCFKNAERRTNVEVILVKVKDKEHKSSFKFAPGNSKESQYNFDDIEKNQVATKDVFASMEARYNKVKELIVDMLKIQSEIDYYADGLTEQTKTITELIKDTYNQHTITHYNSFIEEFRKKCWSNILKKTNIANFTTKSVREDFYKYQEQQGYMAFTKDNMLKLLNELYHSQEAIMQKCVEEAFDLMTKYHKENRCFIEGWKTNDKWQVNKRVILPCMRDSWNGYPCLSWGAKETLTDIEKAMCFITKKSIENINGIEKIFVVSEKKKENNVIYRESKEFGVWYESEFFKAKLFKKGTLHIEFNDEWLYQQFNLTACKYKNWLIQK